MTIKINHGLKIIYIIVVSHQHKLLLCRFYNVHVYSTSKSVTYAQRSLSTHQAPSLYISQRRGNVWQVELKNP